jgi:hypothetical protein
VRALFEQELWLREYAFYARFSEGQFRSVVSVVDPRVPHELRISMMRRRIRTNTSLAAAFAAVLWLECQPSINFACDSGVRRRMNPNLPLYKPEFWDKVQDVFFYQARTGAADASPFNTFRAIPIDGRDHDPIRSQDLTPYGDSVGRWEGDALVIDSVGFTDETWLAWQGYFHTNNMRVVERLRREGNTLIWQATVDDPEVLTQPWEMSPVRRTLNPDPKALLVQDVPCEDRDLDYLGTRER